MLGNTNLKLSELIAEYLSDENYSLDKVDLIF